MKFESESIVNFNHEDLSLELSLENLQTTQLANVLELIYKNNDLDFHIVNNRGSI